MRRLAPAFVLYFLSPLVAEFFLGDFPITYLPIILALAPMYGGGALLIREVTRRVGRGWPTMMTLALAFGVLEEGLTTQSLFNPNYANAHLLDVGFVPPLGIAVPWTIFVLTLHTVWSISAPIAIVEESSGGRRTTPWTRTLGLTVAALLFAVGCVFTFAVSYGDGHFMATLAQLITSGVVALVLVVAAFLWPRRQPTSTGAAPSPWAPFVVALVVGGVVMLSDHLPVWAGVAVTLLAELLAVVFVLVWSARPGWGRWHRYALAAGALLTYSWHAFAMHSLQGRTATIDLVSHIVYAASALAILWYVARRMRRPEAAPIAGEPGTAPATTSAPERVQ